MNRLQYFIMLFALWGVLYTGCSRKEPVKSSENFVTEQIISEKQQVNGYETLRDIERLNKIAQTINQTIGSSNIVVFGDSHINNSVVAVDYALFERLSDDGVAVMVTNAIIQKKVKEENGMSIIYNRLRGDEKVGEYIALAGYGSNGFKEWLEKVNLFSFESGQNPVFSSQRRIYAFLEGYQRANPKQERIR